jgi:hypothetical protein
MGGAMSPPAITVPDRNHVREAISGTTSTTPNAINRSRGSTGDGESVSSRPLPARHASIQPSSTATPRTASVRLASGPEMLCWLSSAQRHNPTSPNAAITRRLVLSPPPDDARTCRRPSLTRFSGFSGTLNPHQTVQDSNGPGRSD